MATVSATLTSEDSIDRELHRLRTRVSEGLRVEVAEVHSALRRTQRELKDTTSLLQKETDQLHALEARRCSLLVQLEHSHALHSPMRTPEKQRSGADCEEVGYYSPSPRSSRPVALIPAPLPPPPSLSQRTPAPWVRVPSLVIPRQMAQLRFQLSELRKKNAQLATCVLQADAAATPTTPASRSTSASLSSTVKRARDRQRFKLACEQEREARRRVEQLRHRLLEKEVSLREMAEGAQHHPLLLQQLEQQQQQQQYGAHREPIPSCTASSSSARLSGACAADELQAALQELQQWRKRLAAATDAHAKAAAEEAEAHRQVTQLSDQLERLKRESKIPSALIAAMRGGSKHGSEDPTDSTPAEVTQNHP